jgi:mannose-1-phosphate guanylyltransferase
MNNHKLVKSSDATRKSDVRAPSLRHLWGIVVRGAGDGARRHYSSALRARESLRRRQRHRFRETVDAAGRCIPPERLVGVLVRGDDSEFTDELRALGGQAVVQPAWRGSAPELFLAALAIAREDRHATVALLPWQNLVGHEGTFMSYVARAARAVDVRPDLVVMIGAPAQRSVRAAAWIEPGPLVDGLEAAAIRVVSRFVRQPSRGETRDLIEGGGLMATRVIVAKVSTLLALGHAVLPDVLETLEPLADGFPGPESDLLCDAVYECMPLADITSALPPRGDGFAVLPFPDFLELDDTPGLAIAS